MNKAQKNFVELKLRVPLNRQYEHEFLAGCIKAWDGYDDMEYSYPAWQLRGLEEKYGTTVNLISRKYAQLPN